MIAMAATGPMTAPAIQALLACLGGSVAGREVLLELVEDEEVEEEEGKLGLKGDTEELEDEADEGVELVLLEVGPDEEVVVETMFYLLIPKT